MGSPVRWFARRSLGFRLNLWYAGVLAFVFGLAALGGRWILQRTIDREQRVFLRTELTMFQTRVAAQGLRDLDGYVIERRTASRQRLFVRVADAEGTEVALSSPGERLSLPADALVPTERIISVSSRGPGGPHPWRVISAGTSDERWLQVGLDDQGRRDLLARLEEGFWILLALGLILGLAGGVLLARRALAPVAGLATACRRILAEGNWRARLPEPSRGADELAQLAALFNQVLSQNQKLVVAMRDALDNVAHDLRTPLSSMRSSAELALQHEDDAVRLREALAETVEESDRVLMMIQTLMDISEAQTGAMRLEQEPVDLGTMARSVLDMYQHVAEEAEVKLTLQIDGPAPAIADRHRLGQAVANLVDNAIKYTDPGGRVVVRVGADSEVAQVAVEDTGIGIDPAHQERIFERLFRADASRSRQGLGLGLSLVQAIVMAHGGEVSVESRPGAGSTFTLRVPRSASAPQPPFSAA